MTCKKVVASLAFQERAAKRRSATLVNSETSPQKEGKMFKNIVIFCLALGLTAVCCSVGTFVAATSTVIAPAEQVIAPTNTALQATLNALKLDATQAPTATVMSTCNGLCWTVDQTKKMITWTGPVDGTEDVWMADEFEKLVESGYSALVPNTTIPWRVELCNTGTPTTTLSVNDKLVDLPSLSECTSTLLIGKGTILLSNNPTPSGGMRLSPQKGYGWNQ